MKAHSINRLLIVGASARAAAWSARRAGLDVVAADLYADADLQELAETIRIEPHEYPQAFAELVCRQKTKVDADAWIYTGCLENYPHLVRKMSRGLTLLGNNANAIGKVRDPFCLWFLTKEGIPFPQVANTEKITDAAATAHRWLLKPFMSGGGNHVRCFEEATPSSSQNRKLYLQQFIAGQPHSAVFMACDQSCDLIGVTRLWSQREMYPAVTRNVFRYCGSIGPVAMSQSLADQWQQIGKAVVRNAGLRGVFGVDAIVSANDATSVVWPIEVNPRYTASVEVLERSLNISLLARHVHTWTGQSECNTAIDDRCSDATRIYGKRILYASCPLSFDEFHDSLLKWQADQDLRQIADQPRPGTEIDAEAPICTLIAGGDNVREVEMALGFTSNEK